MSFLYDAEKQRENLRTTQRLYAVGAAFTWMEHEPQTPSRWTSEGPRWFVMAPTYADALRKVIQENAQQIAACWSNATVECPDLGNRTRERSLRESPFGRRERVLWISYAENCTLNMPDLTPVEDGKEINKLQDTVTVCGIHQNLTFKYLRIS